MSKKTKISLAVIASIVVLGGTCLLTGCGGGGSSSGGNNTPPVAYVPYDPNGEGVRPDVRQYIEETYPDSARTRAALFQSARQLEAAIRDANDRELSRQHAQEASRSVTCMVYTFGSVETAQPQDEELRALILNTDAHNRAYFKYLQQINGVYMKGTDSDKMAAACDIDPATLPN